MENLINLYTQPYHQREPVICLDEKSKQLLKDSRPGLRPAPGKIAVRDYEYVRNGTANIFVAVEPKGGRHYTQVTNRRTKEDYAYFLLSLTEKYVHADCIHIVQDNLNTHSEKSLIAAFGKQKTRKMMKRIQFHFTPKHASWLNMAEVEIGILSRQCIKKRIPDIETLQREVQAWEKQQNQSRRTMHWTFTKQKAQKVFPSLY